MKCRRAYPLAFVAALWLQLATVRASDPLPRLVHTRQTTFLVPFQGDFNGPGKKSLIELQVSEDRGKTWKKVGEARLEDRRFRFRAPHDGEYWFAVRAAGKGDEPASPRPTPGLRVMVDTEPPKLEISAATDAAETITTRITISDPYLKRDSLNLEYHLDRPGAKWERVAMEPIPENAPGPTHYGQVMWKPEPGSGRFNLRIEALDQAGNPAVAETQITIGRVENERVAAQPRGRLTGSAGRDPFLAREEPDPLTDDADSGSKTDSAPGPKQEWLADEQGDSPFDRTGPPLRRSDFEPHPSRPGEGRWRPAAPRRNDAESGADTSRGAIPRARTASSASARPPAIEEEAQRWERVRDPSIAQEPAGTAAAQDWAPPGVKPQMVNSERFELGYDVESVGPWGIRRVELWGTRDYGRTWRQFGLDDNNQSPIVAEVRGEGLYGFRILVQSGSGLVESPPQAGDVPEIWVRVDLNSPTCRITGIDHGSGERAGQVILYWEADDAYPGERPISLSFSPTRGGPWETIASGLRNTGRYVWQLDQRTPEQVYLRLECRDSAGNVRIHEPPEPVSVAPLRPKARIREVRPVGP